MQQLLKRPVLQKQICTSKPMYKVILYDDNINHIQHVQKVLKRTFLDMNQDEAVTKSWEVHNQGSSVVRIYYQELAETCCEQLRLNNLTSKIEPN